MEKLPYKDRFHEEVLYYVDLDILHGQPYELREQHGYPKSFTIQQMLDNIREYLTRTNPGANIVLPSVDTLRISFNVERGYDGDPDSVYLQIMRATPWTPADVYKAEKADAERERLRKEQEDREKEGTKRRELQQLRTLAMKHPDELKKILS